MNIEKTTHFQSDDRSIESACGTALLARLGQEVAHLFDDALQQPLPPRLRSLIEKLDRTRPEGERA